ncbi:MAG: DUF1353 domain-containing protein [Alphaproteobacteria bacterium]|nr:DUF1353 domain-containing protein [Alphaproteobacteria bacterium]
MDLGDGKAVKADGGDKPAGAQLLDLFISYSRRDCIDFADQLAAALEAFGHNPTVDRHGITPGEPWQQRLGHLIAEADTVVFVLSPESAVSDVCKWEVDEAIARSKRIMPVVAMPLGDVAVPEKLQALNFIHFYAEPSVPGSGFGQGLAKLLHALKADAEWLRDHRNLLIRAEAWQLKDRDPDRLIRGTLLAEAEAWLARKPGNAPDLTALQRAYLDACRQAEEADKVAAKKQLEEMQAAQDAREAALKNAQAALEQAKRDQDAREVAQREAVAASKRAEEEARKAEEQARKVARRTMVGMVVAMVLAGVAGYAGYQAYQKSIEATELAAKFAALRVQVEKGLANTASDSTEVVKAPGLGLYPGSFTGRLRVEMLDGGRQVRLLDDFSFKDSTGRVWTAPAGTVSDGASIPQSIWAVIGDPFSGKLRGPSILHDHYVQTKERSWEDTHKMFYEALVAAGVSRSRAQIVYSTVYQFGPRWVSER